MPADIIVYAVIAAGLVFWLRNILGTRHGDERERPNVFTAPPENATEPRPENPYMASDSDVSAEEQIAALAKNKAQPLSVENKTAENGLLDISAADKSFDVNVFLDGAQQAFVMIVESFAEGDRDTLKELLSPSVFNAFDSAISEREARKETQETEIHAIRKAEIIEADISNKAATITLRFTADESSITKNEAGDILSGDPDQVTEMIDIWTFSRDLKSGDPSWLVIETRGEFDGDNEMIPNSD